MIMIMTPRALLIIQRCYYHSFQSCQILLGFGCKILSVHYGRYSPLSRTWGQEWYSAVLSSINMVYILLKHFYLATPKVHSYSFSPLLLWPTANSSLR